MHLDNTYFPSAQDIFASLCHPADTLTAGTVRTDGEPLTADQAAEVVRDATVCAIDVDSRPLPRAEVYAHARRRGSLVQVTKPFPFDGGWRVIVFSANLRTGNWKPSWYVVPEGSSDIYRDGTGRYGGLECVQWHGRSVRGNSSKRAVARAFVEHFCDGAPIDIHSVVSDRDFCVKRQRGAA